MPRNEDGEFELVLGNRQLLSVFFIVVILMGVFFTMGYIVGRNSAPVSATEIAQQRPQKAMPVETPAKTPEPAAEKPPEKAVEAPKPEPVSEPPAKKPEKTEKKDKKDKKSKKEEPAAASKPVSGGVYLQIAAVDEKAAEVMVSTLKQKGFHAMSTQVPDKLQIFRVFVGPFADAGAIADARSKLTSAGFRGGEAIKKTF